jgi:glycosyltransferase involved in cell wall biosynthesis
LTKSFDIFKININTKKELTENLSKFNGLIFFKLLKGLKELIFILKKEKPKLVYIQMNGGISCFREVLFCVVIRIISEAKIIIHFHGILKEFKRNFPFINNDTSILYKLLINFRFYFCNRIIFLSPHILQQFRPLLNFNNCKKSYIIENFTDVNFFKLRQNYNHKINILFVGRLSKAKGFFDLVEAIPHIIRINNNVVFHICGAPESENSLKRIKKKISLYEELGHLVLHGLVKGEKKKSVLSIADILVLPSYNETFSITLLEGLAQGLPIITTDVGVTSTIIEDEKNGYFMRKGNIQDLISKLTLLITNEKLRKEICRNNRTKAIERFDISLCIRKLQKIFYEEIKCE